MVQWLQFHLAVLGTLVRAQSGKIPRATEQLSLCAPTPEPAHPRAHILCTAVKTQHSQRIKSLKKFIKVQVKLLAIKMTNVDDGKTPWVKCMAV